MRVYSNFLKLVLSLAITVWVSVLSALGLAQTENPAVLTIGSKAPSLDIELWFSDREGAFKHTTDFETGKVYLVDFWATWVPATHSWMAKYADLQDRFFDDGVQVIRVTDEDEDSVADFLELDVDDESEMIYAEQALGYCLTSDPDRSVFEDYMEAAGRTKLPTVFIVGKTGIIEWLGHPQKIRRPLEAVVNDKWNREAFKKEADIKRQKKQLAIDIRKHLNAGNPQGALRIVEQRLKDAPDSKEKFMLARVRLGIMLQIDSPKLAEAFTAVAQTPGFGSYELNELAWAVVIREQSGKSVDDELVGVAMETVARAVEIARRENDDDHLGAILDTEAHLALLQGNIDRAVELQTEAVELSPRQEIQDYLDELNEKKMRGEKDGAENPAVQLP